VGTAEVESLAGYIARLAQEHCISPQALLYREVRQRLDTPCGINSTGVTKVFARTVCGVGSVAASVVEAMERLTLRDDLRFTTLTTWADVLSTYGLLRFKRAWCPICYENWAAAGQIVYEPLLWAFEAVTACLRHRQPLIESCPHCSRHLPPLASGSRPGYCSRCRGWLGRLACDSELITEAELKTQIWAARSIGEVLAAAPRLDGPPAKEQLIDSLKLCIDQASWGHIGAFSYMVGLWHITVRRILKGDGWPTLEALLRICSRLNIPLVDLLTGSGEIVVPGAEGVLESLRAHREKLTPKRSATPMALEDVRKELEAALTELPPPSISEIARRTGHHMITIEKKFPQLYAEVVARRANRNVKPVPDEEAEAVLRSTLSEEPPPSLQSVLRRLGFHTTAFYYYTRFPALCLAITGRYKSYRNKPFDEIEAREALQKALAEDPPPSFSEVARRLNHSREFVRRKLPELSKAISSRYKEYNKLRSEENNKRLWREVEEAVHSIVEEGLYVSEQRVRGRLSKRWNEPTFKKVLHTIKRNLGLEK
jgi:transcriptional regulator with XRE-family HTH domain